MFSPSALLKCVAIPAGLFVCSCLAVAVEPTAPRRPNILFIIADDQSPFDLRVYEPESALETPVIDRLAAEGMTIDGAYHMGSWSGAVCTPSRHMVMSGRTVWHLPRNGIRGAGPNPLCPPDLAEYTMAAVFNRAGYDTMRTCKRGNSYEAANQQFTVRRDETKRGAGVEDGSAWHANQVLEYLDERARTDDEDPFLIYFGFSHPHDPRWASDELAAKYGAHNTEIPEHANPKSPALPVNYLPAHPFHHGHPGLRDEVNVQGVKRRRDEPTIRNEVGRQFACGENIDRQIGRVLAKLDAMGELENTYVVYTADHGMAIGRHGLQGKQNLYEHTWRVPLIVKGPGIAAGARAQGNVYLLDFLGTLCDLAGIETPATFEGNSFRPVLEGKVAAIRDVLFGVYCGGTKPGMRCVRRGDWKLIKYDVMDGAVRETQLFDLSRNPREFLQEHQDDAVAALTGIRPERDQTNLAGDPRYAAKLAEMEALLLAEMMRLDDPYRLWDQAPAPPVPPVPEVVIDDGAWCWFQDERAVVDADRVIVGSVASGSRDATRRGDIEVTTWDTGTGRRVTVTLHDGLGLDDHNAPALLVRPDGRYLAVYAGHGQDERVRYRLSSRAGDATAWDAERTVAAVAAGERTGVTYSNVFALESRHEGPPRIVDFHRGDGWDPAVIISDDLGETWRRHGRLLGGPGRPYLKYASGGNGIVHFVASEQHPRDFDNGIIHGFVRDDVVHRSDGTAVGRIGPDPVRPEALTRVFAGDADHVAWPVDVHVDRHGHPRVVFSVQRGGAGQPPGRGGADHRYYEGRWDGGAWRVHEIAYAGTRLYAGEDDYTGLAALDPDDPDVIYISSDADPATGAALVSEADGLRHREIFRGRTRDGGVSWTWSALTRNSTHDNIRPIVPQWDGGRAAVLWLRGTYRSYTDYDLAVVGAIELRN